MNNALGLMEVRGMLSAVIATDAALKSADVYLIDQKRIRGGLTTVEIMGDVAAVTAAIEAGTDAIKSMDTYITSHVIARLDPQVEKMLLEKYNEKANKKESDDNNEKIVEATKDKKDEKSTETKKDNKKKKEKPKKK